jgi:2-polyprenyl-6-hydroxyphenyl methylase/3-demethylubiquinone-9 3-methyltransferase
LSFLSHCKCFRWRWTNSTFIESVRCRDGSVSGFLANELARQGFEVTGLDASPESIKLAQQHDATNRVIYETGDANKLPYPNGSFQVVCAMDFLEHVEDPAQIVSEIGRVLLPGGLFFFPTFNRNLLSWLVVIKGVEWFVKNTPTDLHRLRYFIKPAELRAMCQKKQLNIQSLQGLAPKLNQCAFWKMLVTGRVEDGFTFHFTRNTLTGYVRFAVKQE